MIQLRRRREDVAAPSRKTGFPCCFAYDVDHDAARRHTIGLASYSSSIRRRRARRPPTLPAENKGFAAAAETATSLTAKVDGPGHERPAGHRGDGRGPRRPATETPAPTLARTLAVRRRRRRPRRGVFPLAQKLTSCRDGRPRRSLQGLADAVAPCSRRAAARHGKAGKNMVLRRAARPRRQRRGPRVARERRRAIAPPRGRRRACTRTRMED